jgi:hypothetical protein
MSKPLIIETLKAIQNQLILLNDRVEALEYVQGCIMKHIGVDAKLVDSRPTE